MLSRQPWCQGARLRRVTLRALISHKKDPVGCCVTQQHPVDPIKILPQCQVNLSSLVKLLLTNDIAGLAALDNQQPPLHGEISPKHLSNALVTENSLSNRAGWRNQIAMVGSA